MPTQPKPTARRAARRALQAAERLRRLPPLPERVIVEILGDAEPLPLTVQLGQSPRALPPLPDDPALDHILSR